MAHSIHICLPPPPIHPTACRSLDAGDGEHTSPVPSSGCLAPVVLPLVSVVCVPTKSNGSSRLVCKFSLWEPAGTSQCPSVRCESVFDCVGDQPIIQLRPPVALTVALSVGRIPASNVGIYRETSQSSDHLFIFRPLVLPTDHFPDVGPALVRAKTGYPPQTPTELV